MYITCIFPMPHNNPVRRVNIREFTLADVKIDTCLLYIDYIFESCPVYSKGALLLKMSTFQMDCCRHVSREGRAISVMASRNIQKNYTVIYLTQLL